MNKPAVGFLTALVLAFCLAVPSALAAPAEKEIDELMQRWTDALRSKNLDQMMEAYWPDAIRVVIQPGQPEQRLNGVDEIRKQQHGFFDTGANFADIRFSEPERSFKGRTARYLYKVEAPAFNYIEHFTIAKKAGTWKISEQVIEILPDESE